MIWHLRFAIGAALVATVTSVSLSQENQPKTYEENAKNFAFGKLGFSMTLNEFKREFPRAQIGKGTDEKIGFYHYALDDPQNAASGIAVWFFEGKLLEIGIFYNKDLDRRLEKIGGAKVLLDRLEQKFGKFNPLDYSDDRGKNETKIIWPMPNVGRIIILIETGVDAKIHIGDTSLQKKVNERKSRDANVGF